MKQLGCLALPLALAVGGLGLVVVLGPEDLRAEASTVRLGTDAPVPEEYRALLLDAAGQCAEVNAPLLAAQIDVESGWNPDAVSDSDARGLAQFTDPTWERWGRDADGNGTNSPHDPPDAVDAQARYLCHLFVDLADLPGDPTDRTLAAYHAGPFAVRAHGGRPPTRETRDYVTAVRALLPRYQAVEDAPAPATDCGFTLARANPRTCQQAIDAARAEARSASRVWERWCLAFVAEAYGWGASGEPTANAAWRRLDAADETHPGDLHPPAGALLFYATGDDAGHVALHLGDGQVATNDIAAPGRIDLVPLDHLTDGPWHLTYRGWAPPHFPHGVEGTSRVG
ncbi:transglycosylase SLT domain-containing protein [Streptomyces sedi]|nr:transglycosylase SLT domain-containing protein [Streptomyces sedi]